MNRRAVFVGTGAIAATTLPALAQSKGPAPGPAEMGAAETQHMQETARVGSLALATSRVAVQKASDAKVKQFAQFEVAEQETIAEVLKSMQGANITTGQGKATNAEVNDNLDAKGKDMLKKLQDAKSGLAFDQEYLKGQKDGHNELLAIQERYIKAGKVREQVNVAKLARGQVKEHLVLIDWVTDQMKKG